LTKIAIPDSAGRSLSLSPPINRKFDPERNPRRVMTPAQLRDLVQFAESTCFKLSLRRRLRGRPIDHLGNRRLRTIDELASEELRKGFLKLKAHRAGAHELEGIRMRSGALRKLVNSKVDLRAASIFFFRAAASFRRVVDSNETRLSQLTHERRLFGLGARRF